MPGLVRRGVARFGMAVYGEDFFTFERFSNVFRVEVYYSRG